LILAAIFGYADAKVRNNKFPKFWADCDGGLLEWRKNLEWTQ